MVFSSVSFLFLFLPITLAAYFVCKNIIWRNTVLLAVSLLFYSWGEPRLVLLMLAVTLVAYVGGLVIDKLSSSSRRALKTSVFVITVVLITLGLLYFKYFNFFVQNITALFGISSNVISITLPIGISFYTFQILSYVIDLYLGNVGVQKNYFYLTLYVSFFPQLIAGPIVRYQTVEYEIRQRNVTFYDFSAGIKRFVVGLAKKVIIANNVALIAETVYSGRLNGFGTLMYWIGAVSAALQIYFDFSGYSDMAIGLGRMFGFHFLENFNYPYIATSVTDFWRRWHISLSSWFRDYIYIPLGGNRVGKLRHIFNIFVVWCVTGFWHGASWNFIMWGLYYGVLLIIEKLVVKKLLDKLPKFVGWIYTAFIVLIGWVIFSITDFSEMLFALKQMFTFVPTDFAAVISHNAKLLYSALYLPLGLLFMFPIAKKLSDSENTFVYALYNVVVALLFAVCVVYMFGSTYNPFIYFRF